MKENSQRAPAKGHAQGHTITGAGVRADWHAESQVLTVMHMGTQSQARRAHGVSRSCSEDGA